MEEKERASNPSNITVSAIAGGTAGILELCIMYPIDTVKTRMQSLDTKSGSIFSVLKEMIKTEGAFRPMRGVGVIAATAGPAHGLYFASYEFVKHQMLNSSPESLAFSASVAGTVATILHDLLVNPAEVIKQRLQIENSPYKSIYECAVKTYRDEGLFAFYKSFGAQLLMNIPFQIIHFVTYEMCQKITNPKKEQNIIVHFINGGIAGSAAAAATTPLDVCKTLLNTQEHKTTGIVQAVKTIYKISGPVGFFKGTSARIVYQAPSIALCWSIFESTKYLLGSSQKSK